MGKVSNYDVMKEVGKKIGKGALVPVKFVYAWPTAVREVLEYENDTPNPLGSIIASVSGIVAMPFFNTVMFGPLIPYKSDAIFPGIFFGTLATNAVSGIYEIYRHTKKHMQEKLEKREERDSGKGLENTLSINQ